MLHNNIAINVLNICKNYCATNVDQITIDKNIEVLKWKLPINYLLIYSLFKIKCYDSLQNNLIVLEKSKLYIIFSFFYLSKNRKYELHHQKRDKRKNNWKEDMEI